MAIVFNWRCGSCAAQVVALVVQTRSEVLVGVGAAWDAACHTLTALVGTVNHQIGS